MATYTITTDEPVYFDRMMTIENLCQDQFKGGGKTGHGDSAVSRVIETIRESAYLWAEQECSLSLREARLLVEKLEQMHKDTTPE